MTTIQAVKISNDFRYPNIVEVHGAIAKRGVFMNLAQHIYLNTLARWMFKKATLVRCLTQSDAQIILRYGCPYKKIRVVPNAVDTNLFRPQNGREENLIVWVGRFVPEKGLEYLIRAAKIITDNRKDVKFLLVGDGPLKTKIIKLASDLDINKFIHFTGVLRREEVAKILGKATIFALPSLREGMPFAVLEAMSCGIPVVGSDVIGVRDLIINGENGLLVPAKDPEALAKGILSLLSDTNLRINMGERARRLIIAKYSWDHVISKIERVYYEAMTLLT
jgi:glycosyltransferase involved in cell wall biosynthesis